MGKKSTTESTTELNESTSQKIELTTELELANNSVKLDNDFGDLISRQAAIDAINDLPNCYNGYSDTYDKAYIIGVLEGLPSAQPEIIRCKDCKFNDGVAYCDLHYRDCMKDGYCSWAERKRNG